LSLTLSDLSNRFIFYSLYIHITYMLFDLLRGIFHPLYPIGDQIHAVKPVGVPAGGLDWALGCCCGANCC